MSTKTQVQCELIGDLYGMSNQPSPKKWPEASGQSFKKGQLVYLASGKVTVVADAGVVIWGIALQDASGTVDTLLLIQPLSLTSLIAFCVYHATAASAITAVAGVGTKVTLDVVANKCYAAPTNLNSNASLVVQYIDPRDVVGDIYGRYQCTILYSCLQTIIGA